MPIDRQRAAGWQLVRIGRAHDQRTGAPHLFVQQPTALFSHRRSGRNSSRPARRAVGQVRLGPAPRRISCSTGHGRASCHAASLPASPPPTICTFLLDAMCWDRNRAPPTWGRKMAIKFTIRSVALAGKYSLGAEVPARRSLRLRPDRPRFERKLQPTFEKQAVQAWKNIGQVLKAAAWATGTSSRSPASSPTAASPGQPRHASSSSASPIRRRPCWSPASPIPPCWSRSAVAAKAGTMTDSLKVARPTQSQGRRRRRQPCEGSGGAGRGEEAGRRPGADGRAGPCGYFPRTWC